MLMDIASHGGFRHAAAIGFRHSFRCWLTLMMPALHAAIAFSHATPLLFSAAADFRR